MPSTVPLLPGGVLYYTVSYFFTKDYDLFIQYGKETILTGAGIALGAVAVSIVMTFIKSIKKNGRKTPPPTEDLQ